jgi:hypothetical protein
VLGASSTTASLASSSSVWQAASQFSGDSDNCYLGADSAVTALLTSDDSIAVEALLHMSSLGQPSISSVIKDSVSSVLTTDSHAMKIDSNLSSQSDVTGIKSVMVETPTISVSCNLKGGS